MDNGPGLLGTPVPQQAPTSVPATSVPVRTPMAGVAQMANALVNGYFGQPQQNQNAPMQLSGASMQPGVLSQLWNGFMNQGQAQPQQAAMSSDVNDPSQFNGGVY